MTGPITSQQVGRWVRATVGSTAIGAGTGAALAANLGVMPWDVLHVAVAHLLGVSTGTAIVLVSAGVAAVTWGPLRVQPGPASMIGLVVPGAAADTVRAVVPQATGVVGQVLLVAAGAGVLAGGVVLQWNAGLGLGVRDALMVGLAARGWHVGVARAGVELGAALTGWLLLRGLGVGAVSGVLGWATIALAVVVGPVIAMLRRLVQVRAEVSP
jgi:uncharacterized membrane protein YczE